MKLTSNLDRSLRGAAAVAIVLCALAWNARDANASLLPLATSGTIGTTDVLSASVGNSTLPNGSSVASLSDQPLTLSPDSTGTGVNATLTSIVEAGDPYNPYVNGTLGSNPNALTFLFFLDNNLSGGGNALKSLSLNGFTGWGVQGGYVPLTGETSPSIVSSKAGGGLFVMTFTFSSLASGKTSTELILATNATQWTTTEAAVTSTPTEPTQAPTFMPLPTPEPSSLVLASIGAVLLGLCRCHRRRL